MYKIIKAVIAIPVATHAKPKFTQIIPNTKPAAHGRAGREEKGGLNI